LNPTHLPFDASQALDQFFFRFVILNFHTAVLFRGKPAHGRKDYPAQLKRPDDPQLLEELELVPVVPPSEANVETFFLVSWLWQWGQRGARSASDQRIIFSNTCPQALQRYSYKGIRVHLIIKIYYTPV
jgi:hypothetical protein